MAVIHISEADAVRDFAGLLVQVRAGAEVVIEAGAAPVAVLRPAPVRHGLLLSELIAHAATQGANPGNIAIMDADFAADLENIVAQRRPRGTAWD